MASRGATNRGAEDMLDAQNREYHERLSSKTSFLKSLAFDMEMEAKDHNKLLNGVDDDFDSTSRSVETIKYNDHLNTAFIRNLAFYLFGIGMVLTFE